MIDRDGYKLCQEIHWLLFNSMIEKEISLELTWNGNFSEKSQRLCQSNSKFMFLKNKITVYQFWLLSDLFLYKIKYNNKIKFNYHLLHHNFSTNMFPTIIFLLVGLLITSIMTYCSLIRLYFLLTLKKSLLNNFNLFF